MTDAPTDDDPTAGWEDLKTYIDADDVDDAIVESSYVAAEALVSRFVGSDDVPVEVQHRATLEVGSELYHRKNAPNGVAQFNTFDAAPIRVARDPMIGAYPLLRPFLRPGLA